VGSDVPSILRRLVGAALLAAAIIPSAAAGQRLDGFNVIATPDHRFGSASAALSLAQARRLGASAVAIVPFLWQPDPASPDIVRGADMPDDELRAAIRQARTAGFTVVVKPQVWVPERWAGAVEPDSEADWHAWFARYGRAIAVLARIAAEERADVFAIGTELEKTSRRAEWPDLIAAVRPLFPGTLTYFAHNADEAEAVAFWDRLDAIGVMLYPALGEDPDRPGRLQRMEAEAARLDALAARTGKSILVGEIGLRSADGAAAKPWESAEERASPAAPLLQAEVLGDWLGVLDRPAVRGVMIWRWFTDPGAGGPADTDFTVQGKPAEGVLYCMWTMRCRRPQ
jgi:hypothetical protein